MECYPFWVRADNFTSKTKAMSAIPSSVLEALQQPYPLTSDQVSFYQQNRFIKLKQVLDEATLAFFNDAISRRVAVMNNETRPLE